MKTIEPKFKGNRDQRGFEFELLKRDGKVALFRKHKPEVCPEGYSYEVVLLMNVPLRTFPNGITTDAHEAMPKPEDWGCSGWSYDTLEKAQAKFRSLGK